MNPYGSRPGCKASKAASLCEPVTYVAHSTQLFTLHPSDRVGRPGGSGLSPRSKTTLRRPRHVYVAGIDLVVAYFVSKRIEILG